MFIDAPPWSGWFSTFHSLTPGSGLVKVDRTFLPTGPFPPLIVDVDVDALVVALALPWVPWASVSLPVLAVG
jgi:hypothetical protein